MFEGRQQIGTQTAFLFADSIQVSALQQERKKPLSEILRVFRCGAVSPHKRVEWSPICAAKFFECFTRFWRFASCHQHHAPMSGGKCCRTVLPGSCWLNPR